MEKEIKFNFLPAYHHRFRYLGFGLLFLSVLYLGIYNYLDLSPLDTNIVKWMLAFSLLVVSGSKEKHERKNLLYIRYYAGKFTLTYISSFVLAFHLANFIGNAGLSFDSLNLIIFGLLMYQGSYYFFKFLSNNRNVKVEEGTVFESLRSNKLLYWFFLILSVLTLLFILLYF